MSRKTYLVYIPLGLVCIAWFQYRVLDRGPTFGGDESMWLATSCAFWYYVDGDFDNEFWQSYEGWGSPHAGRYAYAIVLRLAGFPPAKLHKMYSWRHDLAWNKQHGRVPAPEVLLAGRRFSALCGALTCLALCEIGRRMFGWVAGLTACGWLAFNPLMRYCSQRAMMDGPILLAIVAGILLLMILYRAWQIRSVGVVLWLSLFVGVFFGVAASLKINGGILCLLAVAALPFFGIHLYRRRRRNEPASDDSPPILRRLATAGLSVVVACNLALATFYALNPQLWPGGLTNGVIKMVEFRCNDVARQQAKYASTALTTVSQRVPVAFRRLFVKWPTLRKSFRRSSGRPTNTGLWYVEGALFCLGFACLTGRLIRRFRSDHVVDEAFIVMLWILLYSYLVFFAMPLTWHRYYQKYVPIQALLCGISISVVIDIIRRGSRRCKEGFCA